MVARAFTLSVWAVAAASAVLWGLKLYGHGTPAPDPARGVAASPGASPWQGTDLTRLLGAGEAVAASEAAAPPPPVDARYQLLGVVAPRDNPRAAPAVALIAVDGDLPRAYRVGDMVSGATVLLSVHPRSAELGPRQGAVEATLHLTEVAGVPKAAVPQAARIAQPRPGEMTGLGPEPEISQPLAVAPPEQETDPGPAAQPSASPPSRRRNAGGGEDPS